jgi:fused signal recognition particle receptor
MPIPPEILGVAAAAAIIVAVLVAVRRRRRGRGRDITRAGVASESRKPSGQALLRDTLGKTRLGLLARLQAVWGANRDVALRLADLEEVLLTADVGVRTTQTLLERLRPRLRALADADALRRALRDEMRAVLLDGESAGPEGRPHVILVAGVNGVGKTTTIGKLAHRYRQDGKKVLLVAADTFRAAASEQLQRWAERVGADCVRHQSGADPSAVAYDGIAAATARGADVVIVDTAGRLHVKLHLIEELKKVVRVIGRQLPGSPHEVLLVIDATTGQNAINQARVFQEALCLTGLVLTKLDGTAKGGAVLAIRTELGVPIRYVGVGETADDLLPFDADAFVDALLLSEGEAGRASTA